MGWLIALAIFVGLMSIPLGLSVYYDEDGFQVKAIIAFVRITVFPFPKKKKREDKLPAPEKNTAPKAKKTSGSTGTGTKKKGGSLWDFLPFVEIGMRFLNTFRKKLRIKKLVLHVILAGDDPCDLAINYSRAWTAIANFMPRLERFLQIDTRDVEVGCDFVSTQILVLAQLDLAITVGRILNMSLVYGYLLICEFFKFKKKRKGGVSV